MTLIEQLQERGIRRLGSKTSGFRYRRADGRAVSASDLERIRGLVLPPAWTHVAINTNAKGKLQALGKDARGRWQYRYHPEFRRQRERKKFDRLLHFAEALPQMRRRVEQDLRLRGLPREKVMACILRVLATCFIRPGSQVYARENGSFGIATLRNKHVDVRGDKIHFDFMGKSKKRQQRTLQDRRVARIVRQLKRVPGAEVFKWINDEGAIVDVRRRHINDYIKEVMGERFTAKDFRTWAGTLICACALARAGSVEADSKRERKRKLVTAVKETAEVLGNTPSVCKSSYIFPSVLSSFDKGQVVARYFDTVDDLAKHSAGLHYSEKALLQLLHKAQQKLVA